MLENGKTYEKLCFHTRPYQKQQGKEHDRSEKVFRRPVAAVLHQVSLTTKKKHWKFKEKICSM